APIPSRSAGPSAQTSPAQARSIKDRVAAPAASQPVSAASGIASTSTRAMVICTGTPSGPPVSAESTTSTNKNGSGGPEKPSPELIQVELAACHRSTNVASLGSSAPPMREPEDATG